MTTNSKDGILTVSNSAHSHKANIVSSLAGPLLMGIATTMPVVQAMDMVNEMEAVPLEVDIHDQLLEHEIDARPGLKQPIPQHGD